jgi:hypothetical protein
MMEEHRVSWGGGEACEEISWEECTKIHNMEFY